MDYFTKLIFLDFDGVITTYKSKWYIDAAKCELIKELVEQTNARIVITSSWRYATLQETIDKNGLNDWILKDYCIGVTERAIFPVDIDNDWFIPKRGMEIEKFINDYIETHNITEEIKYVIFDDDVFDLLYIQHNNIIQTNWKSGISNSNIKQALKILSK